MKLVKQQRYRNFFANSYKSRTLEQKIDRLHAAHFLLRQIWGNNFLAPIKDHLEIGKKVLDVGCGAGTWICEMASNFPASTFIGIDTRKLHPLNVKPQNSCFETITSLNRLPRNLGTFDYVRYNNIGGPQFSVQETKEILKELIGVTMLYGWVELVLTQNKLITELIKSGQFQKIQLEQEYVLDAGFFGSPRKIYRICAQKVSEQYLY
ncbi:hypothetical protein G9A89_010215 [Geosiphon pyriformis]|nr:hypothetical protein G9A89_010215 [Geosiphon pyriformis]